MRLGSRLGDDRLEAACRRAMAIGTCSSTSIESMLTHDLDRRPLPDTPRVTPAVDPITIRSPKSDHEDRRTCMLSPPTLEKRQALRLTGMLGALMEPRHMPDSGE